MPSRLRAVGAPVSTRSNGPKLRVIAACVLFALLPLVQPTAVVAAPVSSTYYGEVKKVRIYYDLVQGYHHDGSRFYKVVIRGENRNDRKYVATVAWKATGKRTKDASGAYEWGTCDLVMDPYGTRTAEQIIANFSAPPTVTITDVEVVPGSSSSSSAND